MASEIIQIIPQNFTSQEYKTQDVSLLSSFSVATSLSTSSYIESFIYDNNKNILSSNYNFNQYTVLDNGQSAGNDNAVSSIQLDPEALLLDNGYSQGIYNSYFNFFNYQIGSNLQLLYITEISSDRTEIRLDSTALTNADIIEKTNNLIQQRVSSSYFLDFYLNFGENQLAIANNIQLDNQDPTNPTILIKLYEALPSQFDINSTLWVVTQLETPIAYKVTFEPTPIVINDTVPVKGPNFNLDLKDQVNNSTVSLDYTSLTTTTLTSSFNQLSSLLEEKEIDINVDYTDFNNFTHFSSVQARLENFYYKMSLLEDYSSSISILNNTTSNNPSSSLSIYQSKINNIITNFDGYEYYLYYNSGSYAWPKTTSQPPYALASTGSNAVLTWFGSSDENNITYYGGISLSASIFDNLNPNNLYYSIPEYLREDPANEPYQLFVEMVGQFYDNIWIYYKDVTEKYNADNRLENGISKDIVADAIRDFGIKLYQNNFSTNDLYTAFLGLTPGGGLFPFPNITGSLPTPSGFEYVDTLISASNDYMPLDDVNKSLYKRIYHNLPYLLKAKGTLPALRTLITSYGVPDTVLRITEFGGKDKANVNDYDYWENTFNYAWYTTGSDWIDTKWTLNPDWNSPNNVPSTLEFRFKTNGLPQTNIPYSQSLWNLDTKALISLTYTGSGYTSGSYSGSIINPYYQYATLKFHPDTQGLPNVSASVYLPFFDGGWWSIMVNRNGSDFSLYVGNKEYEGGDNNTVLGFYATSSINATPNAWTAGIQALYAYPITTVSGVVYNGFSGSLQEIRYYNTALSESVFKDYIMNPSSIEGNGINSSPNQLAFRASLGGELYTGSNSIHPKVTGSWITTSSYSGASDFGLNSPVTFIPNEEYFFYDQPVIGIKNAISDKIRLENDTLPAGDTLSAIRALAQQPSVSSSYTPNINLLEVAFSPQDEINQDIMDQIGYFNIGEYIGDPRLRSSSTTSYPDLDSLRNAYFEKYTKNYDLNDFVRLIKFFDNSLFKMIKDFVPARTSLASGIVIKQHLLERNKYPQPQTDINSTIAYTTSGSVNNIPFIFQNIEVSGTVAPQWNDYQEGTVENFDGGTGGVFDSFNAVTNTSQSWYETIPTISGSVIVLHNSQDEFYDGEFSGSTLVVTTQSLSQPYPLENIGSYYKQVHYYGTSSVDYSNIKNNYLNNITAPKDGEILFYNEPINLFGGTLNYNLFETKYLKIAKTDCSGSNNTNVLGNINKAVIYNDNVGFYIPYDLAVINEFPTYYLYETSQIYLPSFFPNQLFNYSVSSSVTASYSVGNGSPKTIVNWNSTLAGTNLPHYGTPYFNTSSGILTFENTPNTNLILSASIDTSGNDPSSRFMRLIQNRNGVETIISQDTYNAGGVDSSLLTASLYPIQGDQYYIQLTKASTGVNINVTSAQLLLTQSRAVSSSNCASVIFEPYITLPNYYNSDYNPLINNVEDARLSTTYEDVDYSSGITTPTNFALLISGSATKAAVQDSNYSSKRVILPRYEGSKTTSQHLNYWTPGDVGTYGKLPSVENLKTAVAYCDWIGGWPPDRMNASAIHVLYLIKADGTVVIPNTSQNSLADIKGNFESGENILITSKTVSSGQPQQSRKIIRGGSRIEPILYTQYGQAPNASWNTTISFEDVIPSNTGATGNYSVLYSSNSTFNPTYQVWDKFPLTLTTYGTAVSNNEYTVPTNAVADGVNLIIQAKYNVNIPGSSGFPIYGRVVKQRGATKLYYPDISGVGQYYSAGSFTYTNEGINTFTIPSTELESGDKIYIEIYAEGSSANITNPKLNISQYPTFTLPVTSSGVNSIWNWPNSSSYPYVITSSQTTLVNLYGDLNVKMADITGSGFNPIESPWSIKYGDEFRFEGREDFVYQVGKIFGPAESGSGRLFQTGSIEVHFNTNLPTSASSAVFNLDHFVIRRYVDDASQMIMEGFRPTDSSGPYIVRPEFVVPELNKSVDQFILDLTQKGLIT